MTETAISPLRRRMIDDMKIRGLGQKTQEDYIRAVRNLTRFFGAGPDRAGFEDLRRYQLHMRNEGAGVATINSTVSALRFLFKVTLRRAEDVDQLRYIRGPRKLPVVLSFEEVGRLLEAAPGLKYKAAFSIAYGAGLRASEVVTLKVSDIDSERMVIRVEQGKGPKDRFAMLSPHLLDVLRAWWREGRPTTWLFPGQAPVGAAIQSGLPCCHAPCRYREAGNTAHPSAQLCHPSPGTRHRHSRDPGAARACQARYHSPLHQGRHQNDPGGREPARGHRHGQEGQDAGLTQPLHGAIIAGGRGHLPRPWCCMA